jgi:hypothetical protein
MLLVPTWAVVLIRAELQVDADQREDGVADLLFLSGGTAHVGVRRLAIGRMLARCGGFRR